MTAPLNSLNRILEEKGKGSVALLEVVLLFQLRLNSFQKDIERGTLLHFQSLKKCILTMHISHKQSVKCRFHLLRHIQTYSEGEKVTRALYLH